MDIKQAINEVVTQSSWGQHEAYWLCFYLFAREVLGVEYPEDKSRELDVWATLCGASWWTPYENVCFVSERPVRQCLDDRGVIHAEDGPAMAFRDGTAVYAIHGVVVPSHVVEHPEQITLEEIRSETNAEVRRCMRERYGEGRYLTDIGAKLIDADYEGARKGAAPRALLEDDEGRRFLVGTDGSTRRVYYMEVPPEVATCREAHQALCGFDETKILNKS